MEHRRKGIDIGDVGLMTKSGGFDFLFNILLPRGNPTQAVRTPTDFAPIYPPIHEDDIFKQPEFTPGSYLASSSVKKTQQDGQRGSASVFLSLFL